MSMELYIFSDRRLASMGAWQQALDDGGFGLRLSLDRPIAELHGALPVRFRDRPTTFECDHWNASDLMAELSHIDFGRRWKCVLALRWSGADFYAGISAYLAGSAYALATDGVVFDCEEGKIISPQRAAETAAELERSIPMIEAAARKAVERFRK